MAVWEVIKRLGDNQLGAAAELMTINTFGGWTTPREAEYCHIRKGYFFADGSGDDNLNSFND
jgi:hypothetical protein